MGSSLPETALSRAIQWGKLGLKAGSAALGSFLESSPSGKKDYILHKIAAPAVETMLKLRGGPMKIGQFLSMQDSILPAEFIELLKPLQSQAPAIEFSKIESFLNSKRVNLDNFFKNVNPTAMAAASIGQVHETVTHENQKLVTKFQYPGIGRSMKSDLWLLKVTLKPIFSVLIETNQEVIWNELEQRLLAEIDFSKELQYQEEYHFRFQGSDELVVPKPVRSHSSDYFLSSEPLFGLSLGEAKQCSQALRDKWGLSIFKFILEGILREPQFHADPHPGNFAFLDDGRVIVYDFGQIKPLDSYFQENYRKLLASVVEGSIEEVQQNLWDIGISQVKTGRPVSLGMVEDHLRLLRKALNNGFTNENILSELIDTGEKYWGESRRLDVPYHLIYLHRTFAGLAGLLNTLGAEANWGEELLNICELKKTPSALH